MNNLVVILCLFINLYY